MSDKGLSLSSYDRLEVKVPIIQLTDGDVQEEMDAAVRMVPVYEYSNEGTVCKQDKIYANVEWTENGEPVSGFDGTLRNITVGDGFMPEEFSAGLIGMTVGEEKEFVFGLHKFGTGKDDAEMSDILAKVKIESIRKRVRAELDDIWVKNHVRNCQTVEEFRSLVYDQMQGKAEEQRSEIRNIACVRELATRLQGQVPNEDIDRCLCGLRAQFAEEISKAGVSREEYLSKKNITEEQLSIQQMADAREAAKEGLALELMGKHLKIQVSDSEIEALRKDDFMQSYGVKSDGPLSANEKERLKKVVLCKKTLDVLKENATILEMLEAPDTHKNPFV